MKIARSLEGQSVLRFSNGLQIRFGNLIAAAFIMGVALLLSILSLNIGTETIAFDNLVRFLTGVDGIEESQLFALEVRLPRIILGFMAGACVAMSGAMLQALARNPIADPGLFGLSQGSMVVIMILLVIAPETPKGLIPLAALLGGLLVALLLIWMAGGSQSNGLAILLMGIALETVLSSLSMILILYTPGELSFILSDWLAGSLFSASWGMIASFLPWFILSLPLAIWLGGKLNAYEVGEELAMALGENVRRSRPFILFGAVLLTSAAVTVVGPLIFLGVIAPNLTGFITQCSGRAKLVLSALCGGVLVVGADIVSRTLSGDVALPIGLSLTLVGVPVFILALRLRSLRARMAS